jgi:drug/metabolite transporter (DMT)-like permease
MDKATKQKQYIAIFFAVLAMIIWAGNFIIARDVYKEIPPVSLNFYRWLTASLIIIPIGFKKIRDEWQAIKQSWQYLFWAALTGVAMFNTFVYIGAHYTSAINLALIGTTSSPIFSVIFARIFLKEKIGALKITGMIFCVIGILYLICRGSWENLLSLQFTAGDAWVLVGAITFAIYNTLVKKKPKTISSISFLSVAFSLGTIIVVPFFLWEISRTDSIQWDAHLVFSIVYLGLGASVICFLLWNIAIGRLGTGRAALFGNLIPIFTSLGAVLILHEKFTLIHVVSMLLVFAGILIANLQLKS